MLSILYKGDAAFHELYCDIIVSNVLKIHQKKVKMKKKIQKKFQNGRKIQRYVCYECKIFYGASCFKEDGALFLFLLLLSGSIRMSLSEFQS